ncbi:hypothetical protein ACH42_16235 [Endozoicomonas sp. (ex Bugula neritina AB1)]|nr:hypothetical protein ACH42_16235 [Endozoicomonas sp. (ex Bugula neritina AB1)]
MQNRVATQSYNVPEIQHLSNDVYRVILSPSEGFIPEYKAGQYLLIHLPDDQVSAFSIASAPVIRQARLELHIQKLPDRENSTALFNQLEQGQIKASIAHGLCHLGEIPNKPLTFIAAGTGFAQMKSMIEHCKNISHNKKLNLYWGARSPSDFYLPNLPIQWASDDLIYHPVASEAHVKDEWNGRHGMLYEAIIADKESLSNSEIYISGSPTMVYATVDALLKQGFEESCMHSDVFEYAPRT